MRSMWIIIPALAQFIVDVDGANSSCTINVDNSTLTKGFWDLDTPFGVHCAGIYKKSLAYTDLMYNLPSILTKVIDSINRNNAEITQKYGAGSGEELQQIIEAMETLKTEIKNNQELTNLSLAHDEADRDAVLWNDYLELRREIEGPNLTWFFTRYLLSGPYGYRKINQALALTKTLKNFDPFEEKKKKGFTNSIDSLAILARQTILSLNRSMRATPNMRQREFVKFLKLSLWGNRFDLSASKGEDVNLTGNPIELLNTFDDDLLIDDSTIVWNILNNPNRTRDLVVVDIILDNAGYELFADLCFASFLIVHRVAHKVRFHAKQIPWYVSDTNIRDFHWMIDQMRQSSDTSLKSFGDLCENLLTHGHWTIEADPFWTTYHSYSEMKKQSPGLYKKFSEATLVIFKGDLNYRKLVGDINWEYETSLETVLFHQDFRPSSVLALRTLKSQICVGLTIDKVRLWKKDKNLMANGKYGVITAAVNAPCICAHID